jgi:hypothetical protein
MIHEIGSRVKIVTDYNTGKVSFFKDGVKYDELAAARISIIEFAQILVRTENEVLQLNKVTK